MARFGRRVADFIDHESDSFLDHDIGALAYSGQVICSPCCRWDVIITNDADIFRNTQAKFAANDIHHRKSHVVSGNKNGIRVGRSVKHFTCTFFGTVYSKSTQFMRCKG